jgi:hypothetical protein
VDHVSVVHIVVSGLLGYDLAVRINAQVDLFPPSVFARAVRSGLVIHRHR